MRGFEFDISGNWGHFKKSDTNNNPLTHDIIPKTALIGLIGAVMGIDRARMRSIFPQLSDDLIYGVKLNHPVRKYSIGFTGHSAIMPTAVKSPKAFEFLRDPSYRICLGLLNSRSESLYEEFEKSVIEGYSVYEPVLGIANCPAELSFLNCGEISEIKNDIFSTGGFVISKQHKPNKLEDGFRIGFDKIPTFQNEDFWNLPDKEVEVIYPECSNILTVEGPYREYSYEGRIEKWVLI